MTTIKTKDKNMRKIKLLDFTLIELLIVIAIISILASMLLPALRKARESALQTICAGKIKQLGQAAHMYAGDFKGYGPKSISCANYLFIYSLLGQYVNVSQEHDTGKSLQKVAPDIAFCSKGGRYGTKTNYDPSGNVNYSYGMNAFLQGNYAAEFKRVKNPSSRMLMGTMGIDGWSGSTSAGGTDPYMREHLAFRHEKKGNFCFFDGHVDGVKFLDVPELYLTATQDPHDFWKEH